MNYIVLKFGGSSQCSEGMNVIMKNINEYTLDGTKVIIVISAVGKTTNKLYAILDHYDVYQQIYDEHKSYCESIHIDFSVISELLDQLKKDIDDYKKKPFLDILQQKIKIISYGEYLASVIVSECLKKNGILNNFINAHIIIKNTLSSNTIDPYTLNIKGEFYCDTVINELVQDKTILVYVTQGFISMTSDNKYCVLTRSGSNTTASLISAALNAKRLEIWTDVSGLYTADPRKVSSAKVIPYIKYDICQEAAAMGSQVIHPFSINPCKMKNIPIHIKNTFSPLSLGTVINGKSIDMSNNVYLVSSQNNVTLFKIKSLDMWDAYGIASDILKDFSDEKIDINIITTSQFSITTTTNEKSSIKLANVWKKLKENYDVELKQNCCIVSIIADNVHTNSKIKKILSMIDVHIHITHYGDNGKTLSYVVDGESADILVKFLHDNLFIE